MSTGYRRSNVVPAPPRLPAVSLLDAAIRPGSGEVDLDGNPLAVVSRIASTAEEVRGYRWEAGFRWRPRQCSPFHGRNECAPAVSVTYNDDETTGNDRGWLEHQPVILVAEHPCGSTFDAFDYYRTGAIESLVAAEPKAAELELWEGTLARTAIAAGDASYAENRYLTKNGLAVDVTPTPGTAVSPQRAIYELENFLADLGYGGQGTIHCPAGFPAFLPWDLRPSASVLYSPRNTRVVPGSGYTGSGPATVADGAPTAPAAGKVWLYATDLVTYRQGEIEVIPDDPSQALDRTTNDFVVTAQRSSAGTFDACAVGAVLVQLPA